MGKLRRRVPLLAVLALPLMALTDLAFLLPLRRAPSPIADPALSLWKLCLAVLASLGGRALDWAMAAGAALVVASAIVAVCAACWLAWRTRAFTKTLLEYKTDRLPGRLAALAAELGLIGRVRAVESPRFHAFCFGWLRPQVMVSIGALEALSDNELKALLLHEAHHVRCRDPLRGLLWSAAAAGLFWLPLVRRWSEFQALGRELRADRAAIRALGDSRPLAGALLKAIRQVERQERTAWAGFGTVTARIAQLLSAEGSGVAFRPSPVDLVQSVVALLILMALLCLLLAGGA